MHMDPKPAQTGFDAILEPKNVAVAFKNQYADISLKKLDLISKRKGLFGSLIWNACL